MIKVKNNNLYNLLKKYTFKAIDFLNGTNIVNEVPIFHEINWQKQEGNTFIQQVEIKHEWIIAFDKYKTHLEKLIEYQECLKYIRETKFLKNQTDKLVGSYFGSRRVEKKDIINYILYKHLRKYQLNKCKLSYFNKDYRKLENYLYDKNIYFETIIPLSGFEAEKDVIYLSDNVSLIKLNDTQIIRLLKFGFKFGPFHSDTYCVGKLYAICIKYSLPKIIGSLDHTKKPKIKLPINCENSIVDFLKLFKKGTFTPLGSVQITHNIFIGSYQIGIWKIPTTRDKYLLQKKEINIFCNFWKASLDNNFLSRRFLSIAISRFSFAINRDNFLDKIIDFLITAEALFLNELGNFQGELKYRFSLRAAYFIEESKSERMKVFNFMKKLYDIRSIIVHGSEKEIKLPLKNETDRYEWDEYCNKVEKYLRLALKKAIKLALNPHSPKYLIDWDKVIIENS